MSAEYDTAWVAYCQAKVQAYRAMAAAFRAEACAAALDPYQRNLSDKLAHLREMEDRYTKMASDLLASLTTETAQ